MNEETAMHAFLKRGMRRASLPLLAAVLLSACAPLGTTPPAGVQRLYVFNCGEARVKDVSRWSPGVNAGKQMDFSDNCYLIRHARGLMMWDSGYSDAVAALPKGLDTPLSVARLPRTLASQLAEIGVSPAQVTHLAFSHTHSDHVGNANLFTAATLYMQEPEYDAAFGPNAAKYNFAAANYDRLRANPVVKLKGDHDVFGDGSVIIVSTPGHTPGHQSLLVRLPKTGPVLLSGDAVHFQDNWEQRRVPAFNFDRDESLKSMEKMASLLASTGAQLWINHDKAQSDRTPHAPAFVE
jgi:glyoxylase-like metal-dependent hydrolase (beta-lactamase superfamily II)